MEHSVIKAIRSDNAKMRSRWFFMVRSALFTLVVVILFAALLYLVSFIIFALRRSGIAFAPGFGLSGWLLFFGGLPWGLLLLSLVVILVLAALLTRYEFVYHHPLFYALVSFVFLVVVASFWIAATSFHEEVFRYGTADMPFIGEFYQFETQEPSDIHTGEIIAVIPVGPAGQNSFIITDASGVTSSVMAAPGVFIAHDFNVGDEVMVFGDRQPDGVIDAFGVEKVAP